MIRNVAAMGKGISAIDVELVLDALRHIATAAAESYVEVKRLETARQVAFEAISQKHDLYRDMFERLFAERRLEIDKHFEVLDRGMATNDPAVIQSALRALGDIVARSPFTDLKVLANALEAGEKIEI